MKKQQPRRAHHQQRLDLGPRAAAVLGALHRHQARHHGSHPLDLAGRRAHDIACGQVDIGNAATDMTVRMQAGVPQPDGSTRPSRPWMPSTSPTRCLHGEPAAGRQRAVHDRDGHQDAVHRPRLRRLPLALRRRLGLETRHGRRRGARASPYGDDSSSPMPGPDGPETETRSGLDTSHADADRRPARPRRSGRPPPHLRDHLAPGCRKTTLTEKLLRSAARSSSPARSRPSATASRPARTGWASRRSAASRSSPR